MVVVAVAMAAGMAGAAIAAAAMAAMVAVAMAAAAAATPTPRQRVCARASAPCLACSLAAWVRRTARYVTFYLLTYESYLLFFSHARDD